MRAEGASYAVLSFTRKAGQGVGGAAAAYTIGLGGYVSGAATQSDAAVTSIKIAAGLVPAVAVAAAAAVMLAYPLTEKAFRGPSSPSWPSAARPRDGLRPADAPRMRAEQLTDPVAYHGEGPVWSQRWGGLRWVDMLAGDVLSLRPDGDGRAPARRHDRGRGAAAQPRRRGDRRRARLRARGAGRRRLTTLDELWSDPSVRMNEGGCDPDGRFYCGSMAYDKQPGAGALYRLDPDGSVARRARAT